jgi:hypothetical protein
MIFLLAVGIRLLVVLGQAHGNWFHLEFVASDSRRYINLARTLAQGAGMSVDGIPTASVTPGYPLFLATLSWMGIVTPIGIGLVQCVLGGLTCVLISQLSARLGGRSTSVLAGILSAGYPHLIFWTGYLLTETLFVLGVVGSLVAVARFTERPSMMRAMLAGICLGLAALVRPVILVFAGVVPVWWCWRNRSTGLRALRKGVAIFAGLLIVLAPWVIRNLMVMGAPILTSTEAGPVFYQGNSPEATGGSRGYVDDADYTPLILPVEWPEVRVNRYHWEQALSFLRHHPTAIPRLFLRKLVNMWRPTYADASWRNRIVLGSSYLFILGWACVGIWGALRMPQRCAVVGLLGLFIVTFVIQHGLFTGMIRFRLPVEPALIVFAAFGLERCLTALRRAENIRAEPRCSVRVA